MRTFDPKSRPVVGGDVGIFLTFRRRSVIYHHRRKLNIPTVSRIHLTLRNCSRRISPRERERERDDNARRLKRTSGAPPIAPSSRPRERNARNTLEKKKSSRPGGYIPEDRFDPRYPAEDRCKKHSGTLLGRFATA